MQTGDAMRSELIVGALNSGLKAAFKTADYLWMPRKLSLSDRRCTE